MADAKNAYNFTGFSGNPVGTVISFFGDTAPDGYLSCDGTIYDKALYLELSTHLLSLSSASQYVVDGDETKFKVPDLRGEFLRGTGTNGHAESGSGAAVGVHQKATRIPHVAKQPSGNCIQTNTIATAANVGEYAADTDYSYNRKGWTVSGLGSGSYNSAGANGPYMARPTNTSVLYCIKY